MPTIDPLENISPGLLNAAQIHAYQDKLQLVREEPFEKKRLKTASYEILCAGTAHWWGQDNKRKSAEINQTTPLRIPRNSIVYVVPRVKFSLPDFIAMRFNLTIRMVHRGLLLGTGPLVDPGFEGHLLIPLHNLTSEEIVVESDRGLIWVEFTKLATVEPSNPLVNYQAVPFSEDKKNLEATKYFDNAGNGPFRSVLADVLTEYQKLMKEIRFARYVAYGSIVGLVIAIGALIIATWSVVGDSNNFVLEAQKSFTASKYDSIKVHERLDTLSNKLTELEKKMPEGISKSQSQMKHAETKN